ncbi:transcriptional regulator [Longispora sp. NPDC051575]|uniref:transcriptional regulator n=1 Tax=Longispora sp. NPDC051575 TaxID=3154943 RepID=UPI003419471A
MAISGGMRFRVLMADIFPNGCVMGVDKPEAVTDFEKKGKGDDQERDKQNPDLRVWSVRVHDLDEALEGKAREVLIKISAPHMPVPPVSAFQQVEFEGLTVTPWVEEKSFGGVKRGVQKFSIRASGFKEPGKSSAPSAPASDKKVGA